MSHELYFTSAAKGLRPGSRGFCTVAATQGLPLPLAEKVESLSGYRPLYPPLDPNANLNPVAHSHVRVTVSGKTYSVLSRISPAGLDYSQRANKFAHHIILDSGELPTAGPAWLLGQPGFLESQWDGEVRVIPSGRLPPQGDQAPSVCRNWQELTGDAGWGGVLADWFEKDPNRQVYVIVEPGIELLPLIAETVALLPPERRWQVTFSTYFTGIPQGIPCLWRCVMKDSPEATNAGRLRGQQVLNLCEPLGQAPAGEFVNQARNGRKLSPVGLRPEAGSGDWPLRPEQGEFITSRTEGRASTGRFEHRGSPSSKVPENSVEGSKSRPILPPVRLTKKSSKNWLLAALVGFVCGIAAGVFIASGYLAAANDNAEVNDSLAKSEEETRAELNKKKDESNNLSKEVVDLRLKKKVQEEELAKAKAETGKRDKTILQITKQRDENKTQVIELKAKLSEINAKYDSKAPPFVHPRFALPKWVIGDPEGTKTKKEIQLGLEHEKVHKLRLLGLDDSPLKQSFEDGILQVQLKDEKDKNSRLATFRIEKGKLLFKWDPHKEDEYKKAQSRLRDCVLEITGSREPVHVALREPIKVREEDLRFVSSVKLPALDLPKDEVQGMPSKDLYFGSIEMQLNDDEFHPNSISQKSRPQLTMLSRTVYMKVGDLCVEVATIEKAKP